MPDDPRLAALQRHLDAENDHDVDAIVATFARDGALILNGATYRGHDLLRSVHAGFGFGQTGAFSDLRVRAVTRHVAADAIVVEEVLTGRHTGIWNGLPASGSLFEVGVCGVYEFNDAGELVSERVYFDGEALLRQLRATAST